MSKNVTTQAVRLRFRAGEQTDDSLLDVAVADWLFGDEETPDDVVSTPYGYELLPKPVPMLESDGGNVFVRIDVEGRASAIRFPFRNGSGAAMGRKSSTDDDPLDLPSFGEENDAALLASWVQSVAVFLAKEHDWLVLLVRMDCVSFILCPVSMLKGTSSDPEGDFGALFGVPLLKEGRVLSAGLLSAPESGLSIERWIERCLRSRDPRCPLVGFRPMLWAEHRDLLSKALVPDIGDMADVIQLRPVTDRLRSATFSPESHLPELRSGPEIVPVT